MVIDIYEKEKYFIDFPDPIEAIKFRMEQMDMRQKDLVDLIGFKSRVSEVLNRKRKLTLDMIRKISEVLSIPSEVLIREY
jgi:HTH-type transcriptional regulator/antitoxin HigA